jgi:hypothetical protein
MGGAKARLAWAAARASDLLWLVAMILFLAAMYVRILVCPGKTRKQLDGVIRSVVVSVRRDTGWRWAAAARAFVTASDQTSVYYNAPAHAW